MDIKDITEITKKLSLVEDDNPLVLSDGIEDKYVVISMSDYLKFQDLLKLDVQMHPFKYGTPEVRLLADEDIEITYEEYENIKKQLIEALDQTIKPKLEKLS